MGAMLLTPASIRRFSGTVRGFYTARTPAELAATATLALSQVFQLMFCGCEEFSRSGADYALHGVSLEVPPPRDFLAFMHDHPVLPLLRDLPPLVTLRTMMGSAAFARTDCYNGIARPMGWKDNAIMRLAGAPSAVTISLFRDRPFTGGERELMILLQPHLTAAWRRVAAPSRVMLVPGERRLLLSPALKPVMVDPSLQARLRLYFPGWRETHRLPAPLTAWAAAARAALDRGHQGQPLRSLVIENAQGTLFVCYFPLAGAEAAELRFMERPAELQRWSSALNLSLREREVLHWLAEGKRDGEIAIILGLAPKTVAKHVEHVLAKLQVKNRTAAAAWAPVV